jgi:branched-chain amino acid transport system ATP-binding protein
VTAPLLQVEGLTVKYGNVEALHGISLQVNEGEIVTILGANGAGKSTTLRTISGLLEPTQGAVRFGGAPVHQLPAHKLVRLGIAQAPEGRRIFGTLTVRENLALGAFTRDDPAGIAESEQRVFALFPVLRERSQQLAGTLSGGEQQMLAIGRALMAKPKVMLLDEPSMGLAPVIVQEVFRTIRRLKAEGMTMLLVEQFAKTALEVADYAYVMERGRIFVEGTPAELYRDERVLAAYLGS